MTSSTSETEEQEIYRVISDALLCLCEQKPNDPVDFLSRKMLELIGDDPSTAIRKKEITICHQKCHIKSLIAPFCKFLLIINCTFLQHVQIKRNIIK